MIAEASLVVTRCSMLGTHSGVWLGIAPTHEAVNIKMITTHRIENSKIVEDWVLVEALGFFEQLGLLPDIEQIMHGAAKQQ
jgi:predicted ester cyclase